MCDVKCLPPGILFSSLIFLKGIRCHMTLHERYELPAFFPLRNNIEGHISMPEVPFCFWSQCNKKCRSTLNFIGKWTVFNDKYTFISIYIFLLYAPQFCLFGSFIGGGGGFLFDRHLIFMFNEAFLYWKEKPEFKICENIYKQTWNFYTIT